MNTCQLTVPEVEKALSTLDIHKAIVNHSSECSHKGSSNLEAAFVRNEINIKSLLNTLS